MKSALQEIQDTVIRYAYIIAQVIKVEMEIVDVNLLRIAGSGIYENQVNESLSPQGHIYRHVLATGQAQFIENPRLHPLCRPCRMRGTCTEYAELCMPITLQGETLGVIGLICVDERQKALMTEELETYKAFLSQIADFISAKVYEKREAERTSQMLGLLNQVISKMDKGVLILDAENHILQANPAAVKQLNLGQQAVAGRIAIEPTGDSFLDADEYKLTAGDRVFYVIGTLVPVKRYFGEYASILVFDDIKKVKSGIYNLTSLSAEFCLGDIIGETTGMLELKAQIAKIADSGSTVLITGESGTGKELIARAIHSESRRKNRPFVSINCGAIPDTLLESELFGYVKGAFTGADAKGKIGKFELANNGVIFLDEIGDMPMYLQVKLLRVLQERSISRIGSNQVLDLDVRVIAATNRNLQELIHEGKFRSDLYYRLNVIPMSVPSLRERREDIQAMIGIFIAKYARILNKNITGITPDTVSLLTEYPWPGNVRELENSIEFMMNMADEGGALTMGLLPRSIQEFCSASAPKVAGGLITPLDEVEKEHILKAVELCGADTVGKQLAAKHLGIGIATLYRRLDKYASE